jgi:hypothetical protein
VIDGREQPGTCLLERDKLGCCGVLPARIPDGQADGNFNCGRRRRIAHRLRRVNHGAHRFGAGRIARDGVPLSALSGVHPSVPGRVDIRAHLLVPPEHAESAIAQDIPQDDFEPIDARGSRIRQDPVANS